MKFEEMEYKRPDYEKEKEELSKLYKKLKEQKEAEDFLKVLKEIISILNNRDTMITLAHIRYSLNVNDEFYKKENDYFNEYLPHFQSLDQELYKILDSYDKKEELYEILPEVFFKRINGYLKVFDDSIIEDLQEENKLSSRYDEIMGNAQIEYEGEKYTFSQMTKFTKSLDREVRKKAYAALNKFYESVADVVDDIYDKLVKIRDKEAKKLGFKNYVEIGLLNMGRIGYGIKDIEKLREKVLKYVTPLVVKQSERRRQRLGVDKLMYYDSLEFADGDPLPRGEEKELVEKASKMYHKMDKEVAKFFDFMTENHLFDLTSRKGKQVGGYCTYLNNYETPFVFANFNKTGYDTKVLTHEFGHALQVYSSNLDKPLKLSEILFPTSEAAEVFSTGMELLTEKYMDLFYEEEVNKYYYMDLEDKVLFMPYGCLVDHFQQEVYENPQMTKEERRRLWRKLELTYLPNKDYEGCEFLKLGTYWHRQSHIFTSPFYYIDYVIAHITSLEIWLKSLDNYDEAWNVYMKLLNYGGYKSYMELLKLGNLSSPFDSDILKDIKEKVEEELNNIKGL